MAITIAINNLKGGVGKTTTAINLSAELARTGYRTLIIDNDPQGNATSGLGVGLNDESRTLFEAIIDMQSLPCYTVRENLQLCPSDTRLSAIENKLQGTKGRVNRLKSLIETTQSNYDIIIIDSPPNHGTGTYSALVAADYVIVPMEATLFSVKGLKDMEMTLQIAQTYNSRLRLLGLLLTRFRKTIGHQAIVNEVMSRYPETIFTTIIKESAAISSAQLQRTDVVSYAPGSQGAAQYRAFTQEVLSRINRGNSNTAIEK